MAFLTLNVLITSIILVDLSESPEDATYKPDHVKKILDTLRIKSVLKIRTYPYPGMLESCFLVWTFIYLNT